MIRHICSECGNEIPHDSDFCYQCGNLKSKAFKIDDVGNIQGGEVPCPNCGKPILEGAKFCKHCGIETNMPPQNTTRVSHGMPYNMSHSIPVLQKNGALAMVLAFALGFIGIYGLGHLVLRKWSRGFMFMAMSAVNWYIYFSVGGLVTTIMIISLFIFFRQSMEITNLAYGRV